VSRVTVEPATVDDVDTLTDAWVALAAGQRTHGSWLRAEANRAAVHEDLSRRAVLGEALLARPVDHEDDTDADGLTDDDTGLPGDFLGFVSFGLSVDGFERDGDHGTVHNLYVRPGARSAGVGTALLAAAEAELQAAGADRVTLEALAANERARSFYRAAGYEEHRVELEKPLE
jgi:ribosomal protein S18 acetylase RimI-like enzyme